MLIYMSVLQIAVEKALRAVLSLNYHKASDTLVVHRYEMKSANEEVRNDVLFSPNCDIDEAIY